MQSKFKSQFQINIRDFDIKAKFFKKLMVDYNSGCLFTKSYKISDLKIIEQGLHDFKTIENERGEKKVLEWRVLRTLLRGKS